MLYTPVGAERGLDPVVAGALQVGVAATAAAAVREGLVDHVPGVDLALVVGGDLGDVIDRGVAQRAAGQPLRPGRLLLVPQQRMPADLGAHRLTLAEDPVAVGEGEPALRRFGGVPFHLVLRGHRVEFTVEDPGVRGVAELAGRDGRAEVTAGLRRRRAKGGSRVRGADDGNARRDDHAHRSRREQRETAMPGDGHEEGTFRKRECRGQGESER
jgi:hypothetical protein